MTAAMTVAPTLLEDQNLIQRYISADHSAFHEVRKWYAKELFLFINKQVRNRRTSAVLVTECFEALENRYSVFTSCKDLPVYLYLTAQFKILKYGLPVRTENKRIRVTF